MLKLGGQSWDRLSRDTEASVRNAVARLRSDFPELIWKKALDTSQIHGGIGACVPDGGIFYVNDKLIAIESKKQQNLGNAIERFCKNEGHLKRLGAIYITFFAGAGAAPDGQISKILNAWFWGENGRWDRYENTGNSGFRSVDGFTTEQVYLVILEAIMQET